MTSTCRCLFPCGRSTTFQHACSPCQRSINTALRPRLFPRGPPQGHCLPLVFPLPSFATEAFPPVVLCSLSTRSSPTVCTWSGLLASPGSCPVTALPLPFHCPFMCSYAEFPLALMSLALAFSLALWPWPWPWPFGLLAFWPFGLLAFWPWPWCGPCSFKSPSLLSWCH